MMKRLGSRIVDGERSKAEREERSEEPGFLEIYAGGMQMCFEAEALAISIPRLEAGAPDLSHCLIYQKFQIMDPDYASGPETGEEGEDEFFDCNEEETGKGNGDNVGLMKTTSSSSLPPWDQPEGRLSRFKDYRLLNEPNDYIFIPEPSPMTEDVLEEQEEFLLQLGTDSQGRELRARMQSASLLADMEAFKAANPRAVLEDFVRWYSPFDWIVEENEPESSTKGHLSARMEAAGNTWQEMWDSAKPVPARRQKRLFDETKEAERVFQYLESLSLGKAVFMLLPCFLHAAVNRIWEECLKKVFKKEMKHTSNLYHHAEKAAMAAVTASQSLPVLDKKYEEVMVHIRQAEVQLSALEAIGERVASSFQEADVEVQEFFFSLLESPEVEVPGGPGSHIASHIQALFLEVSKFPVPSAREVILRTSTSRPTPFSKSSPQRLYCVQAPNHFHLCGAFSQDTTFF
ncbi:unnamed protein product [Darwinula stevensoni]|uniref:Rab3 GTPase-activating protein catalytic subunit n=1 Tax=Darwinula stevensoni TaxID=69355 RepID=A0A7R8ZXV8_9CRUS|nr:unnamed protein product [Darwinula stevensoni]CAG0880210.1 unnamed protein product [Darwinula stevensoni]